MRRLLPLAIACSAHAAALGALGATKLAQRAIAGAEPHVSEIELDLSEPSEAHEVRPVEAPVFDMAGAPAARGRAARLDSAAAKAEPMANAKSVSPVEDETPPMDPRPRGWSFSAGAVGIDLRAALTPDLVAPARAPAAEEKPRPATGSTTGGVAEALTAHDVELGLGRGGAILTAAETVARGDEAPLTGGATFDVVVGADGAVVAHLVGADGDADAWGRVAAALGRSVDPRRLRLPPGGRGWHVVVRVDARVQLADGRDVRSLHGLRGSLTPSILSNQIEGKPGSRGSSTGPGGPDHVGGGPSEPPPVGGQLGTSQQPNVAAVAAQALAMRILPFPTLSVEGKVCSAALTVTPLGVGLGGGCSLENVGTGTMRIVSGRILSEGRM